MNDSLTFGVSGSAILPSCEDLFDSGVLLLVGGHEENLRRIVIRQVSLIYSHLALQVLPEREHFSPFIKQESVSKPSLALNEVVIRLFVQFGALDMLEVARGVSFCFQLLVTLLLQVSKLRHNQFLPN